MGIYLRNNADGCLVQGNTVAFNAGDGIVQASCRDNRIGATGWWATRGMASSPATAAAAR